MGVSAEKDDDLMRGLYQRLKESLAVSERPLMQVTASQLGKLLDRNGDRRISLKDLSMMNRELSNPITAEQFYALANGDRFLVKVDLPISHDLKKTASKLRAEKDLKRASLQVASMDSQSAKPYDLTQIERRMNEVVSEYGPGLSVAITGFAPRLLPDSIDMKVRHENPLRETLIALDPDTALGTQDRFDDERLRVTEFTVSGLDKESAARIQRNIRAFEPVIGSQTIDVSPSRFQYDSTRRTLRVQLFETEQSVIQPFPGFTDPNGSRSRMDYIVDHNQHLDSMKRARDEGALRDGAILIQVDTHSDMQLDTPSKAKEFEMFPGRQSYLRISNFINTLAQRGWISEVYWVIPDEYVPAPPGEPTFVASQHFDAYSVTLYRSPKGALSVNDYHNGLSPITVHIGKAKDLPSFRGKDNVALTIDEDFFSNSSLDGRLTFNPSLSELRRALDTFTQILREREVSPSLVTLSASPGYTNKEDHPEIIKYFSRDKSIPDYIPNRADAYRHSNHPQTQAEILKEWQEAIEKRPSKRHLPFDPQVFEALTNAGFEHDLAEAYKKFCTGKLSQKSFVKALLLARTALEHHNRSDTIDNER